MTTVEQEAVVVVHDLEQHFDDSEWCHLYWPGSRDLAICGFTGETHKAKRWDGHSTSCPVCGNRTCVDCLHLVKGDRQ